MFLILKDDTPFYLFKSSNRDMEIDFVQTDLPTSMNQRCSINNHSITMILWDSSIFLLYFKISFYLLFCA